MSIVDQLLVAKKPIQQDSLPYTYKCNNKF